MMSSTNNKRKDKVIIANCSGFYGDRVSAAREMVQGGPIDFLTGDYLAELTMAILFGQKMKNADWGYVKTFLEQMEQILGECLDKGIRVVSNAGGLNPKGLTKDLQKMAEKLGLHPKIAYIEGDELMGRLADLQEKGEAFIHMDKGISLKASKAMPISANAYLGGWGVAEALAQGADVVIGGRLADAALVMGPAAWWFGWKRNDWDKLAGAAVAGHIIECGGQATGGNYSFIDEVPSFINVGFPLAEVYGDGSSVITKHPGSGGLVSVDTVKAQLLYEVRDVKYLTPDVVARFDTIELSQEGPDRTKISGVKGEPPPETTKVCINNAGLNRNSSTVILTGLDIEKKAKIFEEALFAGLGGKEQFDKVDVRLIRSDKEDPETNEEAFAYLRLTVMDPDAKKVADFGAKIIELALTNIPGFSQTTMPTKGSRTIFHWPALISTKHIQQKVVLDGKEFIIDSVQSDPLAPVPLLEEMNIPAVPKGRKIRLPLGRIFATRSGDKGGNANVGVWAKTPEGFAFLREYLTADRLKGLLKDMSQYEIERYEFPNLLAVNFYIRGVLGEGVAASTRMDPQAKTLGEYLRAKVIEMPESLIPH
jgi:hypothetical protein